MTDALQDLKVVIRRLGPADAADVLAASDVFDEPPRRGWAAGFLGTDGNHLLIAYVSDAPVGFISGVEIRHPDKATEMMLYQLGVDQEFRRRGIGRALVEALRAVAVERRCGGMWAPTESDNKAAIATYLAAGAAGPEDATILSWRFPRG